MCFMNPIIIFGFIFLFIGFFPIHFGLKYLKFRKMVLKTPTSKIWDIHKGLTELYGEVVPSDMGTIISPVQKKECVYYKYRIQEYRSHGKSGSYVTIASGKDHRLFYLQDVTGLVLVDSRHANIDIFKKYKFTTGLFKKIPVSVIPFLEKNNIHYKIPIFGHKNMRFEEEVIMPFSNLYVLGNVKNRFNLDEIPVKPGEAEGLLQKSIDDTVYYISDASEKEILKKYKIRSLIGFVFGALAWLVASIIIFYSIFVF